MHAVNSARERALARPPSYVCSMNFGRLLCFLFLLLIIGSCLADGMALSIDSPETVPCNAHIHHHGKEPGTESSTLCYAPQTFQTVRA